MVAIWSGGFMLIALHWLFSWLSYRVKGFGPVVKGHALQLIRDGEDVPGAMRETSTTSRDLERTIRESGYDPGRVHIQQAYLERDGSISIVPAPRVLEVQVEEGVQTVRIEM